VFAARFLGKVCVCVCVCEREREREGVGVGWENLCNVKLFSHCAMVAFVLFL
jgi:hypothetical protein